MTNAQIGITAATAASPARLRADAILHAGLVQLGIALAEGDTRAVALLDALEDLGRLAQSTRREGALDAALDDVATLAHLDGAVMDLTAADVQQLADQARQALPAPHGTVVPLPKQERRRSA